MTEATREEDLIQYLDGLAEEAQAFRHSSEKSWESNKQWFEGEHWPANFLLDPTRTPFTFNRVEHVIRRHVGLLTDTKPTISVLPRIDELHPASLLLMNCVKAIWDERSFDMQLARQLELAAVYSTAGCNVLYNPALDGGRGDIDLVTVHPSAIFLDSAVTTPDQLQDRGEFLFTETVQPLALVRRRYKKGAQVEADAELSAFMPVSKGGYGKFSKLISRLLPTPMRLGGDQSEASQIPRVRVREYWLKDYRLNDSPRPIERNGRVIVPNARLFPGGRHIIRAGDVVLVDDRNPYWDGLFPTELFTWDTELWSRSEVDRLRHLQNALNKVGSVILENAIRSSNPTWIIDVHALDTEQKKKVSNAPGLILYKRPGTEVRREPAPSLPPYVFELAIYLARAMDQVSGLEDVSQGRLQGGALPGVSIEALQMAGQVMVRERARRLEAYLERVFGHVIARIFQFYTDDRVLRLFGDDGETRQFLFRRQELVEKYGERDISAAFQDFVFSVVPGSSLAVTRIQRGTMAAQLFALGVIDAQDVLEKLNWENREEVLRRVNEQRSIGGMIATLQQAGMPVPPELAARAQASRPPATEQGRPRIPTGGPGGEQTRPRSAPAAGELRAGPAANPGGA